MRGGEDELRKSRAQNDSGSFFKRHWHSSCCAKSVQRERKSRRCGIACSATSICPVCHDHHSRGKRKGSHETNTSDTALTLLGLSRSAMEDESCAFVRIWTGEQRVFVCIRLSVSLSLSLSCTKHDMLSMDASTVCMLVDRGGVFIRLSASSAAATPPLTSASCARPSTAAARERA